MEKIASNVVSYSERDIIDAKQLFGWPIMVGPGQVLSNKDPGCNIFNQCVKALPPGDYLVDTKVSMLKTGFLPCIGGWHFDEVARYRTRELGATRGNETGLLDGDLDWEATDPNLDHYLILLDHHTGSFTEFFTRRFDADSLLTLDIRTYSQLHQFIETARASWADQAFTAVENNTFYKFNVFDAHKGQPATGGGWRYFFRATVNSKRPAPNETRTQTNVYVPQHLWEYGY